MRIDCVITTTDGVVEELICCHSQEHAEEVFIQQAKEHLGVNYTDDEIDDIIKEGHDIEDNKAVCLTSIDIPSSLIRSATKSPH